MEHKEHAKTIIVEIECPYCGGTGLFKRPSKIPENAYICDRCSGAAKLVKKITSFKEIEKEKPFTSRKKLSGVTFVIVHIPSNILVGMPYDAFWAIAEMAELKIEW